MKILFTIADANLHGGTEILAFNLLHEMNASNMACRLLSVEPYRGEDPLVISLTEEHRKWSRLQANPVNKLKGSSHSNAYFINQIQVVLNRCSPRDVGTKNYD